MISNKIKASARMLGVGLLAATIGAPATAQTILAQCPFTSWDIDAWYADIGFSPTPGASGAVVSVTCATDNLDFVTLGELERRPVLKDFNGTTVTALATFKHIMVDVQSGYRPDGTGTPQYTLELIRDGSPILDARAGSDIPLSMGEYQECVSALLNSQAWQLWTCSKQ